METDTISSTIIGLIQRISPHRITGAIGPETSFGEQGLAFDSIARVELLAEIDIALGVAVPVQLFADPDLTVGALIGRVEAAKG